MAGQPTVRFRVHVAARPRGVISVEILFDPSRTWGDLDAFHLNGTVGGQAFRGPLTRTGSSWSLLLGPSWCRAPGFAPGDEVDVVMTPEGPSSSSMGEDVRAAFAAEPEAARFFDSLATFYRNNFARSIEAAKRPETRARRLAEMIDLLKQRQRER
jgi:hypothetical protein